MNNFKLLLKKIKNFPLFYKKENLLKILFLRNSQAKYLIRLDDACDTFNFENWRKLENIFDGLKIKPIVAVIPFNKDKSLMLEERKKNFWEIVKNWENKKWQIAVHGHSHIYHKVKKNNLIFPFYNRSEFGELSLEKQSSLIKESYNYFLKKGLNPMIWIAPSHTFDKNTLLALREETKIKFISDGLSLFPFRYLGLTFVPQQLWGFQKKFYGVWTICLHPNTMNNNDILNLEKAIHKDFFLNKIIDFEDAIKYERKLSFLSKIYIKKFWFIQFIKKFIKKFIPKF